MEHEHRLPERKAARSQHDARYVHGQEAASPRDGRGAEGEQPRGADEHGVETRRVEPDAVQDDRRPPSDQPPDHAAQDCLPEEERDDIRARLEGPHQDLDADDREEDGHRIVRSALHLQQSGEPLLHVHALRAEDREDGGRVGGRHDACQKEADDPRQVQDRHRGHGDDRGGQNYPHGGQRQGGSHDGPELGDVGAQAAVEQNEGERDRADPVGERVVLEHDPAQPLLACEHADEQEQHEDRQPHA